jgi:uncharacterized protein YegL
VDNQALQKWQHLKARVEAMHRDGLDYHELLEWVAAAAAQQSDDETGHDDDPIKAL